MGPDYLWDIPENENAQRIKIKNFYRFGLKNTKHCDFCVFITIFSN